MYLETYASSTTIHCVNDKPTYYDLESRNTLSYKNPSAGLGDVKKLNCTLIIKRTTSAIAQVRVTLDSLHLAQPTDGECNTDYVTFRLRDSNNTFPVKRALPDLCGAEPDDEHIVDGTIVTHRNSFYVNFDRNRLDVNIQTNDTYFVRNFNIKFEPIFRDTSFLAPAGCHQYFTADNGDAIYRSLNYQFGSMVGYKEIVSCFTSDDPKRPLKSITLTPKAIGREDAFHLGPLKNARQGDSCSNLDHLEMSSPSTKGQITRFCGSRFNVKSGAKTDGSGNFRATNGVVMVTFIPGGTPTEINGRRLPYLRFKLNGNGDGFYRAKYKTATDHEEYYYYRANPYERIVYRFLVAYLR
ncbi:hypothetical protein HDE_01776 [Halotydeus destructor]|nr:hypothetical protein HDE_01776 [Halotydeus destructor]